MEKDKIFFGEVGLTSTSANFIANMAKELYNSAQTALENVVFYTTSVKLLSASEESILKEGVPSVKEIPDTLKMIADLKSLIAWLREAIKAKERLINEASSLSFSHFGIEVPESPIREDYTSADDVVATFNIKQRNRYYYLETYCATIGQYIHPEGTFSTERDQLQKILHEPHTVSGSGRDTLLYTRKPSLPVQEVEDTFMSLQQTYREYQAELNSIKHQIQDTVNKHNKEVDIKYSQEYSVYRDTMSAAEAELSLKRKQAVESASNLKILIPDSLKGVYERVQSLGK